MKDEQITPDLLMADVFESWPETLPVFLEHRMSCVGCYLSPFDTLGDALRVHGLPVSEVLEILNQRVAEYSAGGYGNHADEPTADSGNPETG
jgi:hybrid cluster-associated redox disulfide protein